MASSCSCTPLIHLILFVGLLGVLGHAWSYTAPKQHHQKNYYQQQQQQDQQQQPRETKVTTKQVADVSQQESLEPCPQNCNNAECPPITKCNTGMVRDRCGCCSVCGLEQDQLCNLDQDIERMKRGGRHLLANAWHGRCGVDLQCRERTDVDARTVGKQSICFCLKEGLVCGSDGNTYSHCQMHAVKEASNSSIAMVSQGPCKSEPKIVTISESREVKNGAKVTFICEVQGYPMPTVTWYFSKPGRPHDSLLLPGDSDELSVSLRGGPQVTRITSHMQITEFSLKHEGQYRCTAENDLGMASRTLSAIRSNSDTPGVTDSGAPGRVLPEKPFDQEWSNGGWDDL